MRVYCLYLAIVFCFLYGCTPISQIEISPSPIIFTPTIKASFTPTITPSPKPTITPTPIPTFSTLSIANIAQIEQVNALETDIFRFVWSPDSLNLLIISPKINSPSQISLIDAYSLKTIWSKDLNSINDADFSSDGQEIVLATDKSLVFVNANTGTDVKQMTCTGNAVSGGFFSDFGLVSFRPDGQSVAYGHSEAIRQEGVDAYVFVTNSSQTCDANLLLKFADNYLKQLEFSPDGKYLMGVFSSTTFLWETSTHKQYAALKTNGISSFNGDGSLLANAYNGEVDLWNVKSLKPIGLYKDKVISQIALNPDGNLLATTSFLNTNDYNGWVIKFWDTKTGEILHITQNLPREPYNLKFSKDGRLLAGIFLGDTLSAPRKLVIWGVKFK